jgi:ComF family protein
MNQCFICALPLTTHAHQQLCKHCIQSPPVFDKTTAAFNYQFPINLLMPIIKSNKNRSHINWMADCLLTVIAKQPLNQLPEVIVPTPISRLKRIRKGFNQTEYLALLMGKKLGINVDRSLISKTSETTAQAKLSAKERRENLTGVFQVRNNNYRNIAIIDDVMTTGSTMNEMAKTLKESGIERVDPWIVARTPL